MDTENIKSFIKYGVNCNLTSSQIREMVLGISIFYAIEILACFLLGGKFVYIGGLVCGISVISVVAIIVITHRMTLRNWLAAFGVISAEATVNFAVMALILCYNNCNNVFVICVLLIPVVTMIAYLTATIISLRKGRFVKSTKKNANFGKLKMYSMLGGSIGIFIARLAFSDMKQSSIITLLIVLSTLLSTVFSLGSVNFYKIKLLDDIKYDERF